MTKPFILGLGGTYRENSRSRIALEAALNFAAESGADVHLIDLKTFVLPLYNADWQVSDYAESAEIAEFLALHRRASAYIWSSPTYHGTVTGGFKNAIDFLEFLDEGEAPYLTGKAVGFISVNDVTTIDTMRTIARELRAWASPSNAILDKNDFAADGSLESPVKLRRLKRISTELLAFAQAMQVG